MAELLGITTLGGLRIRRGEAPITGFRSRKAEALLVYLACSRRPQAREVLADLLWDELSTSHSLTNLRWLLAELSKQLGPYLLITRSTLALCQENAYWLDITEMEGYLDAARRARTQGDTLAASAVRDLEKAVSLYGGPFLQGFNVRDSTGFEDWMLREQDRLQRLVAAALHDLVTYYLERGEHATGMGHAVHLLQLDPLHEETHRQLMLLLILSGQRRAALEQYETCRRTLAAELGAEPGAATTALYEEIRTGRYPVAEPGREQDGRAAQAHKWVRTENLPHPLTPFVGREAELAELSGYLADDNCPLVTVVGAGGSGKTRLATRAAQASAGFPHGVYFVPLAPVGDPSFLVPAIAEALQLSFAGPQEPKAQLFNYLRDKQLLLVLDNFEHLLDGADLLPDLLQAAPNVKLLVTSREPLDLAAEQIFDLAGLPVPSADESDEAASYDSVELFVQRARKAQPRFILSPEVTPWVVRICQLVDGLPLGIELAAVWVRERACQEIAQDLEHDLDVLATTRRDVPARHRSLRAVFDQSWGLLTEEEQKVMRQVSVFRGGFDLEAAAQVASADRALLSRLAQQSLLRQTPSGRYEMHELLRQYATRKLEETRGEREETEKRHAANYMALAEASFHEIRGPRQAEWSNRLEQEHDNLRAALSRALDRQDAETALRTAVGLQLFWYFRAYLSEGRRWLETALATAGPNSEAEMKPEVARARILLRARATNAAGMLAREQGDLAGATKLVEAAVAMLRSIGERVLMAGPINNLALHARDMGDYARAEALMMEALELNRERGDTHAYALVLGGLGKVALWRGDRGRARLLLEESLGMFRELEETRGMAIELTNLGQVAREEGDFERAATLFREGLARYQEMGDKRGITDCLEGLAIAYTRQGNGQQEMERAVTLYGAALALRQTTGAYLADFDRVPLERMLTSTRAELGEEAWVAACSKGKAMALEQAISCALEAPVPAKL